MDFAAAHESGSGTKRPIGGVGFGAALRGIADVKRVLTRRAQICEYTA
jgi:hypothetical protein